MQGSYRDSPRQDEDDGRGKLMDATPPHIGALLGKQVRVAGPHGMGEGQLIAYAPDPSVIIDQADGTRVGLPAAFEITGASEPTPALAAVPLPVRRPAPGEICAVLLPDHLWHEIDPGSYRTWAKADGADGTGGRFLFRAGGELIRGPLSSVLATREAT
jgi:hypothetical protein